MTQFKFLSFDRTPSIEGQMGIVTLLLDDKWIQRFKIVNKKDGSGFFVGVGTLKGEPDGEKQTWLETFIPDRNSVKEELYSFIRTEIGKLSAHPQKGTRDHDVFSDQPLPF